MALSAARASAACSHDMSVNPTPLCVVSTLTKNDAKLSRSTVIACPSRNGFQRLAELVNSGSVIAEVTELAGPHDDVTISGMSAVLASRQGCLAHLPAERVRTDWRQPRRRRVHDLGERLDGRP